MRLTSQSDVSEGPRTYIGLWLRALLRGDSGSYRRLAQYLNRGVKGWNDDEPAVVEAACQLAVRQFFGAYHHVPIRDFVADMRDRISKQKIPPAQEDMEAVIRAAFDDSAFSGNIRRGELLNIRTAVIGNVKDILCFGADDIDRLVRQAETIAMARGYNPPLMSE